MKITIIGTGYVGLVTGACFSEMGNTVYCIDNNDQVVEGLMNGIIHIHEPGLQELVVKNRDKKNIYFEKDMDKGLNNSDICFIAVGTPPDNKGRANLQYVMEAAKKIGQTISKDIIVVIKSTVPIGTAEKVKKIIIDEMKKRGVKHQIHLVSNPEFLKEGSAVMDFMRPDRVVIGSEDPDVIQIMKELYNPFTINHERFIIMDLRSAEMTKYAANSMLATRISFMNEMANICEKVGADINQVRLGIGSDSRIGYSFLYPGCGYGGSCLPKDVKALIKTAQDHNYEPRILKEVEVRNMEQKLALVGKIKERFGDDLSGLTFAIWGLSFKPETDDMRDAPSLVIIKELIGLGAQIQAYDPISMKVAQEKYFKDDSNIRFTENKYEAAKDADAIILITEWKEFRSPDFEELSMILRNRIIFDGRNQYSNDMLKKWGYEYYDIGHRVTKDL